MGFQPLVAGTGGIRKITSKKERHTMSNRRNPLFFLSFLAAAILLCGCETVAGTSKGAVRGAGEDLENAGKAAKAVAEAPGKIDRKMREELW